MTDVRFIPFLRPDISSPVQMFLSITDTYDRCVYHQNMPIFFLQNDLRLFSFQNRLSRFFFFCFSDPKRAIYLKIQWVSNVNRPDGFKTKTIDSTYRFLRALQYEVKKTITLFLVGHERFAFCARVTICC